LTVYRLELFDLALVITAEARTTISTVKFVTNRWKRPELDAELLSVRHTFAENIASNWPTRSGSTQMDYWDQPLTFVITPKSGPLPQIV
jgi:hypothetical protein